jgi:hypothetical protein
MLTYAESRGVRRVAFALERASSNMRMQRFVDRLRSSCHAGHVLASGKTEATVVTVVIGKSAPGISRSTSSPMGGGGHALGGGSRGRAAAALVLGTHELQQVDAAAWLDAEAEDHPKLQEHATRGGGQGKREAQGKGEEDGKQEDPGKQEDQGKGQEDTDGSAAEEADDDAHKHAAADIPRTDDADSPPRGGGVSRSEGAGGGSDAAGVRSVRWDEVVAYGVALRADAVYSIAAAAALLAAGDTRAHAS